jgi:hypothetical protein
MDEEIEAPNAPDWFTSKIQSPELKGELINLARRKGVIADDCEDIASDVILQAMRNHAKYDSGRGPFSAWFNAIAENVINTYWRRQYAQKRKAVGDAQHGSCDDTPQEPIDPSLPVEVQDLVDTAGLSEKERKAMASRLGKGVESVGAEFSRSTDRRAMEKLKHVESDEKFRLRPVGPEASECSMPTNVRCVPPPIWRDTAVKRSWLKSSA